MEIINKTLVVLFFASAMMVSASAFYLKVGNVGMLDDSSYRNKYLKVNPTDKSISYVVDKKDASNEFTVVVQEYQNKIYGTQYSLNYFKFKDDFLCGRGAQLGPNDFQNPLTLENADKYGWDVTIGGINKYISGRDILLIRED